MLVGLGLVVTWARSLPLIAAGTAGHAARGCHLRAAGPGGHLGAGRGAVVAAVPRPGGGRRRRCSASSSPWAATCSASWSTPTRNGCGRPWPRSPGRSVGRRSAGPGPSPPTWPAATGSSPAFTSLLAAGLVAALWWAWAYVLDRRLTSPVEQPGDSRPVKESGWVDRIFPATPAGGVAARTLRYWRRDPRYLAGVAGFLVGPVILIVLQVINPIGNGLVAVFAPTLVGLLVGLEPGPGPVVRRLGPVAARRLGPAWRRRPGRSGVVGAGRSSCR